MFAKKILFPTDFSEASDEAFEHAVDLAHDTGASLLIVHCEEPPIAYGEAYTTLPASVDESLHARLDAIVPPHDIPCEHRLLIGDAAGEIVRIAEEEGVDLIVMGTHGRTGLSRLIMGSVAEAVVRRSSCAVYTVRQRELAGAH
jgi:nucleotide-binding universal stress UspA family protein